MPNGKSRSKGYRGELQARKLCQRSKFKVKWHAEDPVYPDLTLDDKITCEVKFGTEIPKKFYQWFKEKNPDLLLVKRISKNDRMFPWLVVMGFSLFAQLCEKAPYRNPFIPPIKEKIKPGLDKLRKEFGYKDPKKYQKYLDEEESRKARKNSI